jgi:hypothetical protein
VGERNAAIETLARLLIFAPDNGRGRTMLDAIRSGRQSCGAKPETKPESK